MDANAFQPTASTSRHAFFWSLSGPRESSGTPQILESLLDYFSGPEATVLCRTPDRRVALRDISLPHDYREWSLGARVWPFARGSRVRDAIDSFGFPALVLWGLRLAVAKSATIHVAVFRRPAWALAPMLVGALTRRPVLFYLHDGVALACPPNRRVKRALLFALERLLLGRRRVLALTDELADYLRDQHQCETKVLRHRASRNPIQPKRRRRAPHGRTSIGFAGAVYDNNVTNLQWLAATTRQRNDLELELFSRESLASLQRSGVFSPRMTATFEPCYDTLLERMSKCDLLYLPLSFSETDALGGAALRVAFPTKAIDYLLAGPPILVHAPADTAVSRFFLRNRAGFCLTRAGAGALSEWLDIWLKDGRPSAPGGARDAALEPFLTRGHKRGFFEALAWGGSGAQSRTLDRRNLGWRGFS